MKAEFREMTMTPSLAQSSRFFNRVSGAVKSCGLGLGGQLGGQYWYWFSAGVPAAGS
ncbi:hypothetical protein Q427_32765 [Halomonas sp. BC04]|nr:hypothetical protein Q427_32765 [Halomonas sp. BC04]